MRKREKIRYIHIMRVQQGSAYLCTVCLEERNGILGNVLLGGGKLRGDTEKVGT